MRAEAINGKHREVVALGRTAKENAAEIGELLLEVKAGLKHGEFGPWVHAQCTFGQHTARDYMRVAQAKRERARDFNTCSSIREVLAIGKTKPTP